MDLANTWHIQFQLSLISPSAFLILSGRCLLLLGFSSIRIEILLLSVECNTARSDNTSTCDNCISCSARIWIKALRWILKGYFVNKGNRSSRRIAYSSIECQQQDKSWSFTQLKPLNRSSAIKSSYFRFSWMWNAFDGAAGNPERGSHAIYGFWKKNDKRPCDAKRAATIGFGGFAGFANNILNVTV